MSGVYTLLPQFRGQAGSMPWPRRAIWTMTLVVITGLLLYVAANSTHATTYLATRRGDALLEHIKNETLGFQQIFVVNLKSRTDRRDAMALAASMTGLKFKFFEAVTDVARKALPPGGKELDMSDAHYGVYRSHMTVARTMIEEDIQTALILEDDSDWDIRIKEQLTQFAQASRLLVQPLPGTTDEFLDPTHFGTYGDLMFSEFRIGSHKVTPPTTSPYGDIDRWDLLWLGHCGATTPSGGEFKVPLGRVVIPDDHTVPEKQHINVEIGNAVWRDDYPHHTRVVFRSSGNVCTSGYALSLNGAKKLVHSLGIVKMDGPVDTDMDAWCRGGNNRSMHACITAGPQYFQHHRPIGDWSKMSDISGVGPGGWHDHATTRNIRWGTKVNLQKLIDGDTDYFDPYKDGEGVGKSDDK